MTAKKSASVKTKAKKKTATAKKPAAKKTGAKKATAKAKNTSKSKSKSKKATATPTAAKKKATAKKTAPKKTAAPKATAKKTAPKKTAPKPAPKKKSGAVAAIPATPATPVPPSRPSDRAMAIVAQLPNERALTDEEREAMAKCAQTALASLAVDGVPEVIVARIGAFIDEVRAGRLPEPNSQDIRLGLGVLWGEQVRAQVGWRWVHLSYPNGFASYALVPDDRAFACFPLNRLTDLMRSGMDGANTSVPLFDSIRIGALPARRENAYLVIG